MSIIAILVVLILVGFALWLVSLLPLDATVKKIIQVVAIVALVIWLLTKFAPVLGSL